MADRVKSALKFRRERWFTKFPFLKDCTPGGLRRCVWSTLCNIWISCAQTREVKRMDDALALQRREYIVQNNFKTEQLSRYPLAFLSPKFYSCIQLEMNANTLFVGEISSVLRLRFLILHLPMTPLGTCISRRS